MPGGTEELTNGDYTPTAFEPQTDEDGNLTGISVTHGSDNVCDGTTNYSWTTIVMCDPDITEQGAAEIVSADLSNECAPSVTMKHSAGCHIYTANVLTRMVHKYPWLIGVAYLFFGLIVAIRGNKYFSTVASILGAFTVFEAVLILFAEGDLLNTWYQKILVGILAIICCVLAYMMINNNILAAITFVGALASAVVGAMLF